MEAEKLELSERIERRLEMIHAPTKFNVSLGTYYYWYPRYVEMGIFGLFDSKKGPKTPHNKTSDNVASKVVETADYHPELDAPEISKVLECSSGHKPSVSTVQRILRSNGMNRPKGRRSKKRRRKRGQQFKPTRRC
ncbi:helix-turn-helix domain-containing protein [Methanophagales archaeon]|nr:MAG: helix-turn-helix domain-containing protein [Methanophagales archaeon]